MLCAVMSAGAAMPAAAEVVTTALTQELGAAAATEWNGKTALKANTKYVVSKNVTISKKVTIPAGASVTVKNGAKLWVASNGSLYVKGALTVSKGGTLAVTGTLYEYKSKKITINGAMNISSKAKLTINGKLAVGKTGTVKGEPKTISAGPNATLAVNGKNNSKKLAAAFSKSGEIDEAEVKQFMLEATSAIFVDGDIMKALNAMLPAEVIEDMKKEYDSAEDTEMSFEDVMQLISAILIMSVSEQLGGMPESAEITDFDVTPVSVSELTVAEDMAKYYQNIESACKVNASYVLKCGANEFKESFAEDVLLVKIGGKWYFFAESEDEIMPV